MSKKSVCASSLILAAALSQASNIQNVGIVSSNQGPPYTISFGTCIAVANAITYTGGCTFSDPSQGMVPYEQLIKTGVSQSPIITFGQGYLDSDLFCVSTTQGNAYIAGKRYDEGEDYDWTIKKLGPSGFGWSNFFSGPGHRYDAPVGIATDAQEAVYVAGNAFTTPSESDAYVLKYDSAGNLVYKAIFTGSGTGAIVSGIAVDGAGNSYITGYDRQSVRAYVQKIDSSGNLSWLTYLGGLSVRFGQGFSICCNQAGTRIAVTGNIDTTSLLTAMLDGNGNPTWENDIAPNAGLDYTGRYVSLDPNGNPIVAADLTSGVTGLSVVRCVKFDSSSGQTLWSNTFSGINSANGTASPYGLVLDKFGDSYLAASLRDSSYQYISCLLKYNSAGKQMFLGYHQPTGASEGVKSLTIDANADLYTIGYVQDTHGCRSIVNHWAQAAIANDNTYSTPHNTKLTVAAPGVLGDDYFTFGATAMLVTPPSKGTLGLSANGSFTYTPGAGYTGTDTFQYKAIKSGGGGSSNVATVTIHVL